MLRRVLSKTTNFQFLGCNSNYGLMNSYFDKKNSTSIILKFLFDYFKVYSDEQLAKKIKFSVEEIFKWRFQNKIPEEVLDKYQKVINQNVSKPYLVTSRDNYNYDNNKYYTPFEIAEILKIAPMDVISYIQDNKLSAYNLGNGNYRISSIQLNKFLTEIEE